MPKKRLLVSWIGHNDMRAMALSLPQTHAEEILSALSGPAPTDNSLGPLKTLIQQQPFDEIRLLSNYPLTWEKRYAAWLEQPAKTAHVDLSDPTDYGEIFRLVDKQLTTLKSEADWSDTDLCIHLSPGTPAMAAIWLLLGKTRYPATFYQTHKGKAWITEVPFDVAVDFVPEVFRTADAHLQHLTAQSPGEIEGFKRIVGNSQAIRLAVGRASRAALRNVPVLILGETGTGKELFARAIHDSSSRRKGPFLAINCAAISRDLLQSELFGHKAGAFTGAQHDRRGAFDQADGGTLFLDEVGECDLSMQAKLLRVLQPTDQSDPCHRVFHRVGDLEDRHSSVRIIGATNRDLLSAVTQGQFREDLYYRLAAVTLKLPPLRNRQADIPAIAEHLLAGINEQFEREEPGYSHKRISDSAMIFVQNYHWPGNIRQLYNGFLQAAVMAQSDIIEKHDFSDSILESGPESDSAGNVMELPLGEAFNLQEHLNTIQRHYLRRAMRESGGVKSRAAKLLGIPTYQTLDAQLKRLHVEDDWQ